MLDQVNTSAAARFRTRRQDLVELAPDGVLSRADLRRLGWDHRAVARQVAGGRWALHGDETVALHTAPLSLAARRWSAVWEVGAAVAALDGPTALQVAGLKGFSDDRVHVSVKHTARVAVPPGVVLHKVIRRVDDELALAGIPRTTPAVAAVRAAHWAVSNRQAALVLAMPVQQRLVTGSQLTDAVQRVRGRNRRAFIRQVAADIADGAHSLGELDFAALCRRKGLPEPSRQSVRRGLRGSVYLDVSWDDLGLVVEIDGSQHTWGLALTDDHLRQNELVLGDERVLRITLVGLRLQPDLFMDQVVRAHVMLRARAA
ncbi:hypothetical protein SAMN04489867_2219 [Pedococcus dokdonensis]|uniref:DUF559 domain-containing protein n=1 Tax=Pedococcus dokdonensis TaxID=443156 RepID=A0A1H0S5Z7_9MICO|nr:hypothetical protein [Pedococcus dokdonensis]SDP37077.1 hypothetical protein SAMN04489867_2219 [Pedococcus dokdonensis]